MNQKTRWIAGLALAASVIALTVGSVAARDAGSAGVPSTPVGMMGGTSTGSGMMGSGSGQMMAGSGMMGSGSGQMMAGSGMMGSGGMELMHGQMMASMAGQIPADVLARCEALHDQMTGSGTGDQAVTDVAALHDLHHPSSEALD